MHKFIGSCFAPFGVVCNDERWWLHVCPPLSAWHFPLSSWSRVGRFVRSFWMLLPLLAVQRPILLRQLIDHRHDLEHWQT